MGFQEQMKAVMKASLEAWAERCVELWKEYIQKRFYEQYDPWEYERTYQLLNSVVSSEVVESDGGYSVVVRMNDDGVHYEDESTETVWGLAAIGRHGWSGPMTEGQFYNDLMNDFKSGFLRDEYGKILKNMGVRLE